jgi:hypothetical protein
MSIGRLEAAEVPAACTAAEVFGAAVPCAAATSLLGVLGGGTVFDDGAVAGLGSAGGGGGGHFGSPSSSTRVLRTE